MLTASFPDHASPQSPPACLVDETSDSADDDAADLVTLTPLKYCPPQVPYSQRRPHPESAEVPNFIEAALLSTTTLLEASCPMLTTAGMSSSCVPHCITKRGHSRPVSPVHLRLVDTWPSAAPVDYPSRHCLWCAWLAVHAIHDWQSLHRCVRHTA